MPPKAEPIEAEYIPVEGFEPEEVKELAPIVIAQPLEEWKNLFDRMADIRQKVELWEAKTIIKDPKTRDQAIQLRTLVTRTAKLIDEARLNAQKNVQDYIKKMNEYAKDACLPLIGSKEEPSLGVGGRLTAKINAFAEQVKREAEEAKRKALAEQKKIQDELDAWDMEAQMKEEALRLEEEFRLQKIHEEAKAKAQAEGQTETDQMAADIAMAEEQARIDAERATREEAQKKQEAENKRLRDEADAKMAQELAKANAKGKVKGVQEVWSIELLDEEKLDKKFMVFDESKARAILKAGFYNKNEKDPEKIIPGLRCVIVLGKGGK